MKLPKRVYRLLSIFLSFNLIFQSFAPGLVYAVDDLITPEPTPTEQVSQTPEPSATPTEEVTPTPTETPEPTPTEEISPLEPTETPTPSPTEDPLTTPTDEPTITPAITPTQEITPQQDPDGSPSPTPTVEITPSPTPTLAPELVPVVIETTSVISKVFTNKLDYAPSDTVIITGADFAPFQTYNLIISSSDYPGVSYFNTVFTDGTGSFTFESQLDGNYRPNYSVEVRDAAGTVMATTTFTDSDVASHQCTNDLQGANDEPGQKDLNMMCVDETNLPTSVEAEWNWDETGWNGSNTGDACALFDTDGDGFANFSSCVTVEDDPATQASNSPRIYTCSDTKVDRCAGASLVAGPYDSVCDVSIVTPQTFPGGDDSPNDTNAHCTIQLDEVGGSAVAELIDVCSYPSQQPNSDPSDCIVFEPGTGRLEVVKQLEPNTDTGLFNLQINGTTQATDVGDAGTTGEKIYEVGNNGTVFTVGETAGTGTSLSSYSARIECKDLNGTGSVVASSSNSGPLNVTLNEDDDIVCTIINALQNGTVVVHKDVQGPVGEDIVDISQNFTVQLDDADSRLITDGETETYLNVAAGTHTVTESVIPSGYVLYGITPDSDVVTNGAQVTVVAGQTTDVYIVNRVEAQPELGTAKTLTSSSTALVGDTVTFQIQVTNTGNVTLYDAVVSDIYDYDYLQYVSSSPIAFSSHSAPVVDTSDYDGDGDTTEQISTLIWEIGNLAPGDSYILTLTFTALQVTDDSEGNTYTGNEAWTDACLTNTTQCSQGDTITTDPVSAVVDIDALGSISGTKFVDENGNSSWDGEEGELAGVTIRLFNYDEEILGQVGTDVTDSDGNYSFEDLLAGKYAVCEDVPTGYAQTFPGIAQNTVLSDSNGICYVLLITQNGESYTDKDFGNRGDLTISGFKYEDADGNAATTGDQTILSGWGIQLWHWVTSSFVNTGLSDTTDGSGLFSFENLLPGLYQLREVLQAGWTQISPTDNGGYIDVTLTTENDLNNNFANFENISITACKVADPDGILGTETGRTNIAGWAIDLIKDGQTIDDTKATGENGCYTWSNLQPGDYSVTEETQTGWTNLNPTTHNFGDVQSGESYNHTFVNTEYGSIVVIKQTNPDGSRENFEFDASYHNENFLLTDGFFDLSGDLLPGTYSVSELPEEGWDLTSATCDDGSDPSNISLQAGETVTCTFTNQELASIVLVKNTIGGDDTFNFDATGNGLPTDINLTTSGNTASQTFSDLNADNTYTISENDVPAGWDLTSATCDQGETIESINLSPGETVTCTFTNTKLGNVIVVKYNDHNGNGTKDDGDEVLDGWEMHLVGQDVDAYQFTGNGDPAVSGQVTFSDIMPGEYTLSEQVKQGWGLTNIACGNEVGIDDDNSHPIVLEAGEDLTCYVGNQGQGSITVNKNLDTDDVEGADVFGYEDMYWELDSADHAMGSTVSVAAGSYSISEVQLANYHFTSLVCKDLDVGSQNTTVDVAPGEDVVCTYTNTRDTGTVIVHKIIDVDGDPSTTEDQSDGQNWTIDVDGQEGDTSNPDTQVTGGDGLTTFSSLKTGNYNVSELLEDGYDFVEAYCDGQEIDTGETTLLDVAVGSDQVVNCTFINTPNGTIHGYKWNDLDGEGDVDFDEPKLPNWTIYLYESNGEGFESEPLATVQTDDSELHYGWYWFENLLPGTYQVCEELKTGWTQTYPDPACHTMTLPDDNSNGFRESTNATNGPEYNFGNTLVPPTLNLTKTNNAFGDKTPGSSVTFTLTLTVSGNDISGVKVIDLPAKGFKYRLGTWQAKLNGFNYVIDEPVYHSPGTWNLGDLLEGDIVELTYIADIDTTQTPGLYFDLAWANGEGVGGPVLAVGSDGAFVGTDVNVVKDNQDSPTREVENKEVIQGQVLGATTLPATGSDTSWLYLGLIFGFLGVGFTSAGLINRKKYE